MKKYGSDGRKSAAKYASVVNCLVRGLTFIVCDPPLTPKMESLMEAWTDDIPICRSAGIGTVNNEIYRKDGRRVEMHPMRCRSAT